MRGCDWWDYPEYENEFDDIAYDDDPSGISNVSSLRHYINCHGITDKLKSFLGLTWGEIDSVRAICFGSISIEDIKADAKGCIDRCWEEGQKKLESARKRQELIQQLKDKRESFCGVGTRKVKLLLNKRAKEGDTLARAYRLALEAEDESIKAKEDVRYMEAHYNKKASCISELASLCRAEGYVMGRGVSDVRDTSHILYLELPGCEQISFHCNLSSDIPPYTKEWDGKVNSTLFKLEDAIRRRYY